MICALRSRLRIRSIVQSASETQVKVVLISIPEERIFLHAHVEILIQVKQLHDIQLYGIYLIEELVVDVSVVSV